MRPGAGRRRYTYVVPDRLADLEDGEAVLVEFGRRQALGIVLGPARPAPGVDAAKPIVDRVRADGPLLPRPEPDARRLDRRDVPCAPVGRHPGDAPAGDPRAARARRRATSRARRGAASPARRGCARAARGRAGASAELAPADGALLDQLADGPRAVRDLAAPEGRAGLLRRLRAMAAAGWIDLDWTLLAATGGPRYERWVVRRPSRAARPRRSSTRETDQRVDHSGRARSRSSPSSRMDRRPGCPAATLGGRHGTSALAGLVRRGLAAVDVRERPRRPLDARPVGLRGGRRPAADLTGPQAEARRTRSGRRSTRTTRPHCSSTGSQAAARPRSTPRRSPPRSSAAGPPWSSCRRSPWRCHSSIGSGRISTPASRSSTPRSGRVSGPTSGGGSGPVVVDIVVGTRLAVARPARRRRPDRRRRGAREHLQERPHATASGARHGDRARASRRARRSSSAARRRPSTASGGLARVPTGGSCCRTGRPGAPPTVEVVDLRAELAAGNRGLLSDRLVAAMRELDPVRRRPGDPRHQPAGDRIGRPVPRLRSRPDLPGVRAAARLPRSAGGSLRCHHCGTAAPMADRCPTCRSPRIRYLGGGTERVEREVRTRFPQLRVGRLDRDVVEREGRRRACHRRVP